MGAFYDMALTNIVKCHAGSREAVIHASNTTDTNILLSELHDQRLVFSGRGLCLQ